MPFASGRIGFLIRPWRVSQICPKRASSRYINRKVRETENVANTSAMTSGSFSPDFPAFGIPLRMAGIGSELPPSVACQHAIDRRKRHAFPHILLNQWFESGIATMPLFCASASTSSKMPASRSRSAHAWLPQCGFRLGRLHSPFGNPGKSCAYRTGGIYGAVRWPAPSAPGSFPNPEATVLPVPASIFPLSLRCAATPAPHPYALPRLPDVPYHDPPRTMACYHCL